MVHRDSEHSIYSDYTMALAAEGGEGGLQLLTEENKKMHVYVNFYQRPPMPPVSKRTLRKALWVGLKWRLRVLKLSRVIRCRGF